MDKGTTTCAKGEPEVVGRGSGSYPVEVHCYAAFLSGRGQMTEHLLDHTHITPANTLVQKVLSNLTVICVECGGLVKASAMEKHADAKCQTHTMPAHFPQQCDSAIYIYFVKGTVIP